MNKKTRAGIPKIPSGYGANILYEGSRAKMTRF